MGPQARGVDLNNVLQAIQVNRYSEDFGESRVDEVGPRKIPSWQAATASLEFSQQSCSNVEPVLGLYGRYDVIA